MTQHEDDSPCVQHRSAFDTIPAPPPDCHVIEPVFHLTRAGREKLAEMGLTPDAATGMFEAKLVFPGGEVDLPKPTRADLVLSAQQWVTAVREHWHLYYRGENAEHVDAAMLGKLTRLDAVLKELAES